MSHDEFQKHNAKILTPSFVVLLALTVIGFSLIAVRFIWGLGAVSNMSDGYVDEWVDTLENLKKLDFDVVLPGHGEAFTDRKKIDYFQAYMRDVWSEVSRLKQQGVSAEEAAKRADLTKHKDHLPIQAPGVPLIGVQRIYALLDGK